jgi:hypothetical protein
VMQNGGLMWMVLAAMPPRPMSRARSLHNSIALNVLWRGFLRFLVLHDLQPAHETLGMGQFVFRGGATVAD